MKWTSRLSYRLRTIGIIVAVFLFGLFALTPFAGKALTFKAEASGMWDPIPIPDPDPEPDPELDVTLFWFSDYADSQEYCQQLENHYSNLTVHWTYIPWDEQNRTFHNMVTSAEFNAPSDAYVILELRHDITSCFSSAGAEDIENLFGYWKEQNCKTMFISGTEELKFYYQRDFLDYVDIHINTDHFTAFMANLLYKVELFCDSPQISNVTFLLDAVLSEGIEDGYKSSWFFKEYLITFIRSVYREEISPGPKTNQQVLLDHNIKIVSHLGGDKYFDAVNGIEYDSSSDDSSFQELVYNDKIYAIGSTVNGYSYAYNWYERAKDIKRRIGIEDDYFEMYVYNEAGYRFYDDKVQMGGVGSGRIPTIIDDFINDRDLTKYDNWTGRCIVTFKDGNFGSGGWMIDLLALLGDSSLGEDPFLKFLTLWQCWLNDMPDGDTLSDVELAYGYSDGW